MRIVQLLFFFALYEYAYLLLTQLQTCLKCYYDEKMFLSFSVDSDFIFGKNAPCKLLRLNFKTSLIFLTTISRLNCPPLSDCVPVELNSES